MSASFAQIWEEVRSFAITSLVMKLSVVPGRKCLGQMMADWVGLEDIVCSSLEALEVAVCWGVRSQGWIWRRDMGFDMRVRLMGLK